MRGFSAAFCLLLFLCSPAPAATSAIGLVDYARTPWGMGRAAVLQTLSPAAADYRLSDGEPRFLGVNLGVSEALGRPYTLIGTYVFDRDDRLFIINIRPLTAAGELVPGSELSALYAAMAAYHTREFGQPDEVDAACETFTNCRRTNWHLEDGESVLAVAEVLDPGNEQVYVSRYSKKLADRLGRTQAEEK